MSIGASLVELEQRARRLVSGINWDRLDQQSIGVPLDPNQSPHIDYWYLDLLPAFDKAAAVMNTLYFDPHIVNSASVRDSISEIGERISRRTAEIIATFTAQGVTGMLKVGIELTVYALRDLISLVWGVTMYGISLHGPPAFPVTTLGRAAWREHASRLVMMMEAIKILDDIGVLGVLKWDSGYMKDLRQEQGLPRDLVNLNKQSQNGLGALPVIGLIIGGVTAIVLIAGIWIWSKTTLELNLQALDSIERLCKDPAYAKDNSQACLQAINEKRPPADFNPFQSAISAVMPYLFAGVLIVGGIYFAPVIVPKIRGALKAAKAP